MLPALCIQDTHYSYHREKQVWDILEKCNFSQRYNFYQHLISHHYTQNKLLLDKFIQTHSKAIKWTKSLSDERDQVVLKRNEAREFSNSGNAIVLALQLIKTCSNYNNLTKITMNSLSGSLSYLSMDMVCYAIMKHLSDKQECYS